MLLAAGIALLLFAPQDPVRVQAVLGTDRIGAGGSTVLTITVETSGEPPDDVPVPVLPPGLDIGPISDFSQLQVTFPGGRRRLTRREVVLVGGAPGNYRIPPVVVTVAGRTYRTAPLQLAVGQGAAAVDGSERVRLRAWVRPARVYVGEQVLYQVEAVFPEELRLRQARPPSFAPPPVTGFWAFDPPEPVTVSLRMSGSEAVEVQNFRRVLFPLAAGTRHIPPAQLQYELREGIANAPRVHSLASAPVTVEVRPLPAGAPAAFTGAVGSYRVRAALSSSRATVGEPLVLNLTVEGSGNLKTLVRPGLPPLSGLAAYPGSEPASMSLVGDGVSGSKRFVWTIVPRVPGSTTIPPIEFSWFDPATASYQSTRTAPLGIDVQAAGGGPTAGGLRPLHPGPRVPTLRWTLSPGFAALQLLPVLALLAALVFRRRRPPVPALESDPQPALGPDTDPRVWLEQLSRWLARQPPSREVVELRTRVQQARFGPLPPTAADCERLAQAARSLPRSRPGLASHAWPVAVLALWQLAGGPAPAGDAAFGQGLAAHEAGNHDRAAASFAARVRAEPGDQAAWYNLGTSWAHAGERGQATWALLRSLELDPRDADARHNLQVTATRDAAALAPLVPLSRAELALLGALLWWTLSALAWLAFARPHRAFRAALAAVLPFLLLTAGTLAARESRAERAIVLADGPLLRGPARQAEPLGPLEAGAPVVVLQHRPDWALVRSPDLREGWVAAGRLGPLDPGPW